MVTQIRTHSDRECRAVGSVWNGSQGRFEEVVSHQIPSICLPLCYIRPSPGPGSNTHTHTHTRLKCLCVTHIALQATAVLPTDTVSLE